jgi:hypothetical protein
MRKHIYFFIIFLLPILSFSHPASDIKIQYDVEKSEVVVEIIHSVRDPKDHYIYEVDVLVNNKKTIKQFASAQVNNTSQNLIYVIPGLKYGDKIEIIAECNKYGKIKKSFLIEQKEKDKKE